MRTRPHPQGARPQVKGHGRLAGILMLVTAMTLATMLPCVQYAQSHAQTTTADGHETRVAQAKGLTKEWESAVEYNRRLPSQTVEGDGMDDKDYMSQLDNPADGIMSTIEYPRLGIRLPVRHGSTKNALAAGAGHLYGSSLPVGGKNTRTVITAHRGGVDKPLFTRLGEARKGDVFYLTTLNRTLAYKVTDIRTVLPSQADKLKPVKGRDMATLLTCTPYGVNTHRLLVSGVRAPMPQAAPLPRDAPKDRLPLIAVGTLAVGWTAVIVRIIKVRKRR